MFELVVLARLMYALLDLPFRLVWLMFCFLATNTSVALTFFLYISFHFMDEKEAIAMDAAAAATVAMGWNCIVVNRGRKSILAFYTPIDPRL